MLKTLFFTILLALVVPVFAGSFMNHEKFVHLSYQEQKKIVVSMMELMTEMEMKYHQQVRTSGFDAERFRRYTFFMQKMANFLFPEAHAARNVRYGQYLNELRLITQNNVRNKCIYAGWISDMNGDLCVHPRAASNQLRNLYQTEAGCNGESSSRDEITCNPAIFGFKNVAQKTLFCVPAGQGKADNSSRDCMVKALKNPPEQGASSVQERINNIIAGIAANPNDANAVFDFLTQACACEAGKSPQISEHYANYMRPHQTCYSILRMMSEFGPQCPATSSPLDQGQLTFLRSIKGLLTDDQIRMDETPANTNGQNVRTLYTAGIEGLRRDNTEFRNAETAICGSAPTPAPVTCPEDRRRIENLPCCLPNQIANADKRECIARPDDNSCPEPRRKPESAGGGCCEENKTWNATSNSCAPASGGLTVSGDTPTRTDGTTVTSDQPTTVDEIVVTGRRCNRETHEWVGPDESMQCLPKCPPGVTRNTTDNSCPTPPTTSACTGANQEEIPTAERTANGPTCRCVVGHAALPPNGGTCPAPTTCTGENQEEIPTAERTANGPTCRCVVGHAALPPNGGACPAPSTTSMSVSVKVENKADNSNATVSLTVTPSDYTTADYKIIWFRKGYPQTDPAPARRSGTTGTLTQDTVDPDAPASTTTTTTTTNTSETPGENETRIEGKDDQLSFDVDRNATSDYQVCARLIKKSDNSIAARDCKTVQKKTPARPPVRRSNGGMMPFPQQQPFMRGGSSDATFRGVR